MTPPPASPSAGSAATAGLHAGVDAPRIVIIGAGPTGLAAGYRLRELGVTNFTILEARTEVGGLASSERSANGFTYDIGGHVLFSHYPYFDRLFDRLMGDEYQELVREAWVWMCDRFLPYPFQNNIRHLPREVVLECLLGLIDAQRDPLDLAQVAHFGDLIERQFGRGIARHFMLPYNFKVWAYPAATMNKEWIGERVSIPSIERVLGNVILDRDDAGWGPNNTFKYPRFGGTGGLFNRMRPFVADQLRVNAPVIGVDIDQQDVLLEDGARVRYDLLLNTTPLDQLVHALRTERADRVPDTVREHAAQLRHSSSYIVGVGVNQPSPSTKCWMYFPELNCPFYRVTYLSNYSPDVVPDATRQYSLLAEISRSPVKPVDGARVVEDTIRGMINTQLLQERDQDDIIDTHVIEREYTYPTPGLERDAALATVLPWLESHGIFSRGRFGAWRYEVGNMDHSVAQGVEWVDRVILGDRESELTYQAKRGC
jgi:UDP-galactopyranose mutase